MFIIWTMLSPLQKKKNHCHLYELKDEIFMIANHYYQLSKLKDKNNDDSVC